ncbi:MAG: hypothetical protein ACTHMI_11605 [Mucilaginibacter sp.]
MSNIKFNYLYRDSGNFKQYGSVLFSNSTDIELSQIESLIRSKLIDGTWLYANEWGIPELFFENCDFRLEPTWHEFEGIEYDHELAHSACSIEEFIASVESR